MDDENASVAFYPIPDKLTDDYKTFTTHTSAVSFLFALLLLILRSLGGNSAPETIFYNIHDNMYYVNHFPKKLVFFNIILPKLLTFL